MTGSAYSCNSVWHLERYNPLHVKSLGKRLHRREPSFDRFAKDVYPLDLELRWIALCNGLGNCLFKLGGNKQIHLPAICSTSGGWLQQTLHWACQPNDVPVPRQLYNNLYFHALELIYIYIRELFWYSAKCTACNYPEILHGSWKRCIPFQPRCVLLLALVVCCGGSFLLEQPSSSVMGEYIRMQWFTRIIRVTWLELYLAGGLTWPSIKMHMWIKTAQDQDCDIFL
jgi:hypothetical protein